jgi:DNA-binding NarL/FixJ family response regulator
MKKTRILVADDHAIVREGLCLLLENENDFEICGYAKTGREAVELAESLRPEIVLLDIWMPELTGLEAARQIKRVLPDAELLIFTANESEDLVRQVFAAGAKSFIQKADASSHLIEAIKSLRDHKPFFTSRTSEVLFAKFLGDSNGSQGPVEKGTLSEREREVVRLLGEGNSNKEVAAELGISVRTVEVHRATVMKKVGARSFSELIRWAIRNHLVSS